MLLDTAAAALGWLSHRLIQKEELGGSLVLIWFLFGFVFLLQRNLDFLGDCFGVGFFFFLFIRGCCDVMILVA